MRRTAATEEWLRAAARSSSLDPDLVGERGIFSWGGRGEWGEWGDGGYSRGWAGWARWVGPVGPRPREGGVLLLFLFSFFSFCIFFLLFIFSSVLIQFKIFMHLIKLSLLHHNYLCNI